MAGKGPRKGLKRPCARDAQKNCFLLRNEQRQAYKHNTLLFNNKYTNSIRAHLHNTSFRTDTKPPAGHRIPCAPQLLLTAAATPSCAKNRENSLLFPHLFSNWLTRRCRHGFTAEFGFFDWYKTALEALCTGNPAKRCGAGCPSVPNHPPATERRHRPLLHSTETDGFPRVGKPQPVSTNGGMKQTNPRPKGRPNSLSL